MNEMRSFFLHKWDINSKMKQQKSLKINAILNMIKTLMGVIFPLITFPYSSRILGPNGIGQVNFANSIVSYFSMIAGLGIGTYATREAAKIRDNNYELNKFSKEIIIINSTSTIVAYILFFISLFLVPKFHQYKILLCISSITILFNTIGLGWIYSAMEDYLYITVRSIIFQIFSLILLFTTVKTSEDIYEYCGLMVISSVGSNLLNFIHSRKYISIFQKTKIEIKKHLKPIFILFAMSVAVSIYTVLDTSMLGLLTDNTEVGFYSAATKINKLVLSLVSSLTAVLLPRLSYYTNQANKEDFNKLAYKGFSLLLLISIPSTLGLNLLSKNIILILNGIEFLPALEVMKILNPIVIIIGLSGFIGMQIFLPLKKEKWTLISVIIGAIVNFISNLIFIPKYGAYGAAISTILAESMVTITQLVLLRKLINIFIIIKQFIIYFFNSIIMYFPLIYIKKYISNIYTSTIVCMIVGIIIYSILLIIEKNEFIMYFLEKIKRFYAKKQK